MQPITPITILLVEDNPADARLVREMLADAGPTEFRLVHATRLAEALLRLQQDGDVAVILLDLSLPDGQGLDTVTRLHAAAPRVPIVVVSGYNDEALAIQGVREGAQDYLVKGRVESDLLVRALRYAIERKRAEEHLEYLAHHDTLTGLPNRALFHDRLRQSLAHARRHDHPLALFFLDLDGFKLINDTLGHDSGDLLLREVARRLTGCTRESDTVARLGGDEFTIILPDITHIDEVTVVARKVLAVLAEPIVVKGQELPITTSIGISLYPASGQDVDALIKSADIAMYRAKEQGKNTFEFFTADMNRQAHEQLALKQDLRHALTREQLMLHYQPQVDLASGRIVAMKALVRWQHPALGLIPPADFIPIAEETGLSGEINAWILRAACAQHRVWQAEGLCPPRVAVNISPQQFRRRDAVGAIGNILREVPLAPDCLAVEIAEEVVMRNADDSLSKLCQLKAWGVELAINDFGTASSSLRYLKRFPLDKLKIDRSFIHGMARDGAPGHSADGADEDIAIVGAIVALAHSFNLKVLAEGVETAGQAAFLQLLGCDQMQGRLFSPPLVAAAASELLRERRHHLATSSGDVLARPA